MNPLLRLPIIVGEIVSILVGGYADMLRLFALFF